MTITTILPLFLVGALAVQMRDDLGFGAAQLGLVASAFFGTSAATAPIGGRLVDRYGWQRSSRAAAATSLVALAGIAFVVHSWAGLIVAMALGGLVHSLGSPAANVALAEEVGKRRRALAFAVKQTGVPIAGLVAGFSVPLFALTVGWRWAFVIGLLAPLAVWAASPAGGPMRRQQLRPVVRLPHIRELIGLSVAAAFASGVVSALGAFVVASLVASGVSPGRAGVYLAVGSAFGLGIRLVAGWLVDRRESAGFHQVAGLLAVGVIGYLLLGHAGGVGLLLGTVLAYGAGWGWPGVFHFAVVEHHPESPATATGVVVVGLSIGGGLGPLGFGLVTEIWSYDDAWTVLAALTLVSSAIVLRNGARLTRARTAGDDDVRAGDRFAQTADVPPSTE